jgi:glycosyltransferase involved in cell wall biosynthesis
MKVCHVCSGHTADDRRVFHRICSTLAAVGYEVHLIAIDKRMEAYSDRGVTIHPLPESSGRRERLARRSRVAQLAADIAPDLFHVHEPELLGPVIARSHARPVIYDVHESYVDVVMDREWIPRTLRPAVRYAWDRWERKLVRRCAGVVAASEGIAHRYRPLHGKVQVVANYPELVGIEGLAPVSRDGKTCVFAGGLMPNRGLTWVFAAMATLKERGLIIPLEIAGAPMSEEYLRSLWREADRLGIRAQIRYHGVLSKPETMLLQQRASIGLVPYLPVANNMAGMPNKLVECMALGLPVVFSDFPSYQAVAGSSGAGIAVDPTKPEQIATAIERLVREPALAQRMGEAGRRAIDDRFNWNVERGKLLEMYEDILAVETPRLRRQQAA